MAIIQETFDISPDIMTKILTGEYRRIGGVVRHDVGPNKGQIVKLLKPADKAAEESKGIGAKAFHFARNNKKALIIVVVSTGLAAAVIGIYRKLRLKEPESVTKFRELIKMYINTIRTGKLDVEIIDNLMDALESLKNHKNYKKLCIQLSIEEFNILVNKIYEYTVQLAEDNAVELADDELVHTEDAIISLHRCLNKQKEIFAMLA